MSYKIDYANDDREDGDAYPVPTNIRRLPARRRMEIPSVVKTALTLILCALAFFGAEMFAPANFKPSHLVGTYDARLAETTKAAELQQQARYENWAESVKLANAQNLEQYKSTAGAVLAYYNASYERAKLFADATARIQGAYVNQRMATTARQQSTDTEVIGWTRLFGRLANALQRGAGDGALNYAGNLSRELEGEMFAAAQNGQTISVEGWDTNLPSPAEVQAQLNALKPVELPAPPSLYPSSLTSGR